MYRIAQAHEKGLPEDLFLPMVKVIPKLVSLDLVSVQPLKAPSGSLFYLDYQEDFIRGGYYVQS